MRSFIILVCSVFVLGSTSAQKNRPCRTPNNEEAKCVSIYSCSVLYYAVTTKDPKQLEFLRKSQCGFDTQRNEALVCCGTQANYKEDTDAPIGRRGTTGNGRARYDLVPDRSTCGYQESDKIYHGENTTLNEFPWMALLEYVNSAGVRKFSCGGSLISPKYVMTAAHCVTGPIEKSVGKLVNVRLGEWDTRQGRDCIQQLFGIETCNDPPQNIKVEKILFYEDYSPDSRNRFHDIALLRLERAVQFSEFIRPLCLPLPSEQSRAGEKLTVAGWGRTEDLKSSHVKLKVQLPLATKSECKKIFSTAKVSLGDGQICAGGEADGRDSCTGDSGGPLMRTAKNDSAQWYVEGIVSFGAACGSNGWPAVYTKVSSYLDWIYSNIEP